MRKLTKKQRAAWTADDYRKVDEMDYCPQNFIDALRDLDEADRELEELRLQQGRAWAEAECDRVTANLNDACDERDELRAKLAEAERQLEITQDGLMDVQKRLIDREDKLAEAEAASLKWQALSNTYRFDNEGMASELEALRKVERAARWFEDNPVTSVTAKVSHRITLLREALTAVDALRKEKQ